MPKEMNGLQEITFGLLSQLGTSVFDILSLPEEKEKS